MLLISDLHFTDKTADRYRFKIFTWVYEYFMRTGDKNLIILGDLTDSKDHHSANLVNAIVKRMLDLTGKGMEIFLLKGNHDYIDPDMPFFEFLGQYEYINYIKDPQCWLIEGYSCLFLPHTRQPLADWAVNRTVEKAMKTAAYVFMHESVIGSVTSNGYEMEKGLAPSYFRKFGGEVISGDIHCPQTIGRVSYVGTPYSIRFNDDYRGRALTITEGEVAELFPDIRNRTTLDVSSVREFMDKAIEQRTLVGDQIKIRYQLSEADEEKWEAIRKKLYMACKNLHLELVVLQVVRPRPLPLRGKKNRLQEAFDVLLPGKVVDKFAKQRGISKAKRKAGRRLVEE